MKAVLDVGQFVSATINDRGHPGQTLARWQAGAFELVTSPSILDDLRRVLFYPRLRQHHQWTDEQIQIFLNRIALGATFTPGHLREVNLVQDDPTDDKILACALEGRVDYIVPSDDHLVKLRSFREIPIVPPRRFLEILEADDRLER